MLFSSSLCPDFLTGASLSGKDSGHSIILAGCKRVFLDRISSSRLLVTFGKGKAAVLRVRVGIAGIQNIKKKTIIITINQS